MDHTAPRVWERGSISHGTKAGPKEVAGARFVEALG